MSTALVAAGCVADPAPEPVGSRTEPICCGIQCCIIDRLCYFAGDVNPANPCQTCEPFSDFEGWTTDPDCTFDGGPPVSMPDAGPTPDAGAAVADGGAVVRDGGPAGAPDAGGCTASPTPPGAPALAGLALATLALVALRRRRRPR